MMNSLSAFVLGRRDIPSAWSRNDLLTGRDRIPLLTRLGAGLNVIGTLWIVALMGLICADVIARGAFDQPLPRVPEFVGYSIVAIVFLQMPNTLHLRKLTRADVFIDNLMIHRPVAGNIYCAAFSFIGLVVLGLISYGLIPDAWYSYESGEYFGQHNEIIVPVWPFKAIMSLCAVITAFEFLMMTIDYLIKAVRQELDHPDALQNRPVGWWLVAVLIISPLILYSVLQGELEPRSIGMVLVVAMLVMILAGMHIGIALIFLSFIGAWFIREDFYTAVNLLTIASAGAIQDQLFGVIPLFVLMGMLVNLGNIGRDTFDVCQWLLGKLAGGLGVATVVANAIFAAITGVSIASAVVFTKVSVPPMIEHGYSAKFSVGIVAGSSVLGMLIPPSLLLIVFGVLAEVSVGQLFTAAIAPGILLSLAFCIAIVGMCKFMPDFTGHFHNPNIHQLPQAWSIKPEESERESWPSALLKIFPISLLIVAVLGGIYGGVFTPTEAGAVGAFLSLIIVLIKGWFTPDLISINKLWKVLIDTGHVSVSILFLIIAANMYTRMLALSGLPNDVVTMLIEADFGFYAVVLLYLLIVLIMGMVLDSVSIMLITLPLILPVLAIFNTDLIWFGIVTVVAVEIGLLTPPLGLTVYVVKAALGNTRITLSDIFIGAFPFVMIMILVTIMLVFFPQLTLWTR